MLRCLVQEVEDRTSSAAGPARTTRGAIARAAHISPSQLTNLTQGTSWPQVVTMVRLADVLGVRLESEAYERELKLVQRKLARETQPLPKLPSPQWKQPSPGR